MISAISIRLSPSSVRAAAMTSEADSGTAGPLRATDS